MLLYVKSRQVRAGIAFSNCPLHSTTTVTPECLDISHRLWNQNNTRARQQLAYTGSRVAFSRPEPHSRRIIRFISRSQKKNPIEMLSVIVIPQFISLSVYTEGTSFFNVRYLTRLNWLYHFGKHDITLSTLSFGGELGYHYFKQLWLKKFFFILKMYWLSKLKFQFTQFLYFTHNIFILCIIFSNIQN